MSLIQDNSFSIFQLRRHHSATSRRWHPLTLRNSEGKQVKRSISYQQLHTADQLTWVISAIRRDLAEQASDLPQISMLQSQNRFALPTYHSA
ncbi:hypothetical protein Ddc_20384 [Ditylenchus destructor]|nr:hypothetical protein Ddc_20384 [Ditylenchus destructor]